MKKPPIARYIFGVVIAVIVVNVVAAILRGSVHPAVVIFSAGFLLGVLAMYIAIHLYRVN